MINFTEGLERALLESDLPIVTDYEFLVLGSRLFEQKEVAGERLKRLPAEWDFPRSRKTMRRLQKRRSVVLDSDFRSGVWRVVQSTRSGSAEEIACIVDPFCYVSHLSAMQRYGLTDRSPEALHLTTPARPIWNMLRDQKVARDSVGDGQDLAHPALLRYGFAETIRRRPIVLHESSHPATAVEVRGERTRITSIGRTFADMLSEPGLCGGMHHVMDVWQNHAENWVEEITAEANRFDNKMVKVRAGYLFTDVLRIENETIASWVINAQRGGSRKLDPNGAYAPLFSERWMLSINV